MPSPIAHDGQLFRRILVPTDLGPLSEVVYRHGLRLALGGVRGGAGARGPGREGLFVLVHVAEEGLAVPWTDFPSFRHTAAGWGFCRAEGDRTDVDDLGLQTAIVRIDDDAAVPAILSELRQHGPELLVVGNHRHGGLSHWVGHTVSEPVARRAGRPTLFLPEGCRSFVDAATGQVSLRRVLVPVTEHPDPALGVDATARLLRTLGVTDAVIFLLHLDEAGTLPRVPLPREPGWDWRGQVLEGDVVPEILRIAGQWPADLVVMGTLGHDHTTDDVFGTRTEQVLRAAPCPVLSVPHPSAT